MSALSGRVLGELAVLLAERADVLREEIRAKLGEAADEVLAGEYQWGDAGSAASQADVEIAEARRDIAELAAVRMAQARMDEGNYGDCTDCGAPIPVPRLRAQPAAPRCVTCQEKQEHAARMQPA
jgi:RNA polymerase-binding transcription factor DksA